MEEKRLKEEQLEEERTISPQSSPASPPPLTLKTEMSPQPQTTSSPPLAQTMQMTSELTIHQPADHSQQQQRPSLPPPPLPPPPAPLPCGKITNFCPKHPHIEITLDGKELWDQFYRQGTEMIVNRAGRRMFPGFAVTVTGLKPKAKYTMRLDVMLADNHRFKFLNARWLAVGSAEPQPPYNTYTHHDSPNTGSFWMRHGVSFKKLKITNNKDKPIANNKDKPEPQTALLHSMHKYFLRLMIEEEKKIIHGETKQPQTTSRPILSMEFPETTFIAVTAYQNEEVTHLKITNNPFAKAFRENATDLDWETAQAICGNPSPYISTLGATIAPSGNYNYLMSPSPSPWAIHSPMLPSPHSFHTLTPQPHHSIQAAGGSSSSSHYSPDQFRHPLPPTPHADAFFQWPTGQHSAGTAAYLPHLVPTYTPLHHQIETSPLAAAMEVLPDFSSFFPPGISSHLYC